MRPTQEMLVLRISVNEYTKYGQEICGYTSLYIRTVLHLSLSCLYVPYHTCLYPACTYCTTLVSILSVQLCMEYVHGSNLQHLIGTDGKSFPFEVRTYDICGVCVCVCVHTHIGSMPICILFPSLPPYPPPPSLCPSEDNPDHSAGVGRAGTPPLAWCCSQGSACTLPHQTHQLCLCIHMYVHTYVCLCCYHLNVCICTHIHMCIHAYVKNVCDLNAGIGRPSRPLYVRNSEHWQIALQTSVTCASIVSATFQH